ncbi:hypothetical protein GBA63_15485 [Rubrobacter tropicus]|uniref:Uncharacterized protein n=1 Tax=Rubrobacter tropicus TaxID=2653851 RepID=A0A6G8QBM5_9ACTN|nr:hypothetical protein [Rubrobacter tropicus]QIN83886.1 hypothetical protein GBA63_15485 [Rubrobacter tropicus]
MVRNDDSPGPETDHQDAGPGSPRKRGAFFWIALACLPATVTFGALDGDLLHVGTFSALGLYLILQQTGSRGRSAAWRWAHDASAVAFSTLALLLFLRNFGLV